jgi:hypothetical protein
VNNAQIYAALRERYCAPEHALFFEVANGTGSNIRRYADAVAMNLFPSRGLTLSGFEIKVARHDWQRELKNPHKVEEGVYKYCDHWWIVALPEVVAIAELPPTWGLLVLTERGLRQSVAAPRLEAHDMNRSFIAALLRRASNVDEAAVNALVQKKYDVRAAQLNDEVERRVKSRLCEVEEKLAKVQNIERQLGVCLTDWAAHDGYGRLLKAMDVSGIAKSWAGLRQLARQLGGMAQRLDKHIADFDALAPEVKKDKVA